MTEEIWKPIFIANGNTLRTNYEVSSLGRIRCKDTFFGIRRGPDNRNRIRKTPPDLKGHLTVSLYTNGTPHTLRVARLVGKEFCHDFAPSRRPVYLDGDKSNCAASNLKWVPQKEITGLPFSKNPKP